MMAMSSSYVAALSKDAMLFETNQDHLLSGFGIGPAQNETIGHDYCVRTTAVGLPAGVCVRQRHPTVSQAVSPGPSLR